MRGRGVVTLYNITREPGERNYEEKTDEAGTLEQIAAVYDAQAKRMNHVAGRLKVDGSGTKDP